MSSIAKINASNSLKNFFKILFAVDIEDENSGLNKYINNEDNTLESKENAKIARQLQDSLNSIELSLINEAPKKRGTLSLNTKTSKVKSEKSLEKNEHIKDDNDKDLSK